MYWCKDKSQLVQRTETQGSKYAASVCKSFGMVVQASWEPEVQPVCLGGLIEVPMNFSG
jgi:hypothetical protein